MEPKQFDYEIVICASQGQAIKITATSCEEACEKVKAIVAYGGKEYDRWRINSTHRPHWLVMRTEPFEYCDHLHVQEWNGEYFKTMERLPVGSSLSGKYLPHAQSAQLAAA